MLSELYKKLDSDFKFVEIDPSYNRLVPIEVEQDGKIVKTTEFKRFNVVEQNINFVYTDFSISNLTAVGALNNLKGIVLSPNSDMTFVDEFAKSISTDVPSK